MVRVWPSEEALEEELARELSSSSGGDARLTGLALGGDCSWRRLADELAPPAPRLDPVIARLAIHEACRQAVAGTGMTSGRGVEDAAARLIAEAERAALGPDELLAAAAGEPALEVLARAYARFARLTDGRDSGDRRRGRALVAARQGAPGPALAIRPPLVIEPADIQLVLALARTRPVRLELPWGSGRPGVFAGMEPILSACEAAIEGHDLELALVDPAERSAAPALVRALGGPEGAPVTPPPGWLELLAAPTPEAELAAICARVRDRVDAGAPPETIAVVAREPAMLADRLEEELARVGLPLGRGQAPGLDAAPVFRFVASLLAVADGGFAREEALAVLASRYLPGRGHEKVAAAARALGLRELAPGAGLERLDDELAAPLRPILGALASLPADGPPAAHAAALARVLVELGVARRARAYDPALARASEHDDAGLRATIERALGRDQVAVERLEELLGQIARFPAGGASGALGFARLLADLAGHAPLQATGARGGAVRLIGLGELSGRSFAHVFACRLVDGIAPARARDDGLYGDRERRHLNRALRRWALPAARDSEAPAQERTPFESLLLLQALAAAQGSVVLSWPLTLDGRACLPSPFVEEIRRRVPSVTPVALPRAPVASLAAARAPRDVILRAALESFADPAGRLPPPVGEGVDLSPPLARFVGPRLARVAALAAIERRRFGFFSGQHAADEWTGAIGPLAPGLSARLGGQRPLPAGSLERLANCGFQFFAERVLGARSADEADAAPSRLDLGRLAHRCLEAFYRNRARAGALPLAGSDDDLAALERACAAVFAEETGVPRGAEALWKIGQGKLVGELRRVILADARTPLSGGVPAWFELPFGTGAPDSLPALEFADEDGRPLRIAGRIDRVDRVDGGLVVLDYKLGALATERAKLRGDAVGVTQLQLPIYAAAARSLDNEWVDAAFVSLRDAAVTPTLGKTLGPTLTPGVSDAFFDELGAEIGRLATKLRRGELTVAPIDCRGCQWKTACRVVALHQDDEDEVAS